MAEAAPAYALLLPFSFAISQLPSEFNTPLHFVCYAPRGSFSMSSHSCYAAFIS